MMQGSIRSFDSKALATMKKRIHEIATNVAKGFECEADVKLVDLYPPIINHAKETEHVIRLAKLNFGEKNFSQLDLPLSCSEDFSYFLHEKPGCFYALGTMKEGKKLMTLHTSTYDYNDDLIASGAYFFLKIVEDRLGVNLLDEKEKKKDKKK